MLSAAPLEPSDKISPLLADQVTGALLVVFHPDAEMAAARDAVRAHGFDVLENPALLPRASGGFGSAQRDRRAGRVRRSGIHHARIRRAGGRDSAGRLRRSGHRGRSGRRVRTGEPRLAQGRRRECRIELFHPLADRQDGYGPPPGRKSNVRCASGRDTPISRCRRENSRGPNGRWTSCSPAARTATAIPSMARGERWRIRFILLRRTRNRSPATCTWTRDEPWRSGADVDLYSVVLHETGHALGLGHSDRPGAVMYPYYKLSTGLTDDDIAGIRALYGSNVPALPAPNARRRRLPTNANTAAGNAPDPDSAIGLRGHHSAVPADQVPGIHDPLDHRGDHRHQRSGQRQRRGHGRQVEQLDRRRRSGVGNGILVRQRSSPGRHESDHGARLGCGR